MKKYDKEDIKVVWKQELCKHAAECAKGLPSVFKPKDRPWIQPEGASKDEIIEVVGRCPSGALTIEK
ncbi:MAG: (4Fe-4S)-binding protein [Crocinitomicaceae bacterium]